MLSGEESGIGNLNHQAALTAALAAEREIKLYKKYTEKKRYKIGNHASENGIVTACRKFKSKFNIRESTVQTLKNKYKKMIKSAKRKKRNTRKSNQRKKTRSTHLTRRDQRYGAKILIILKKERWIST